MRHEETFFKRHRQINLIVLLRTNNPSCLFTKDLGKEIARRSRHVLFGRLGKPSLRKMVFIFLTQKNETPCITCIYKYRKEHFMKEFMTTNVDREL